MFAELKKIIAGLLRRESLRQELESSKMLSARILEELNIKNAERILEEISRAEFQVFSQWGDDGIVSFLADYLEIEKKEFIEFGVENYKESNTRYLLQRRNWRGLIMDGSENNMRQVKSQDLYWKYDLTAKAVFVTTENINEEIASAGFHGDIGLLSLDIDGNDYWIWKQINAVSPAVVVVEYNSLFGSEQPWTIPYNAGFYRTAAHYTNLYYGTSLLSLCDLAEEKGYCFVGCNSNGNNAFFVRKDKIKELKPLSAREGFVLSKVRESRDREGRLTHVTGSDRIRLIEGMEVLNTRTGLMERIQSA